MKISGPHDLELKQLHFTPKWPPRNGSCLLPNFLSGDMAVIGPLQTCKLLNISEDYLSTRHT